MYKFVGKNGNKRPLNENIFASSKKIQHQHSTLNLADHALNNAKSN